MPKLSIEELENRAADAERRQKQEAAKASTFKAQIRHAKKAKLKQAAIILGEGILMNAERSVVDDLVAKYVRDPKDQGQLTREKIEALLK